MISPLPRPDNCAGAPVDLQRTARRPRTVALLSAFVAATLCVAAPDLLAQQGRVAEVPTIEPQFTRVYAAEAPTQIRFPSLSPDGRWIAFSTWGTDFEGGLWLVPAEGGEAIRLTQGAWDDGPVWFPSGDRIAFRSDRPARGGDGGSYVMSLAIDPETGEPAGPPRQVSVERCFAWLDVAPDGESIAFSAWVGDKKAILVVPSAGGASQILANELVNRPAWSSDGNSLYYAVDRPGTGGDALVRVSAEGSDPDTVFNWPQSIWVFGYPESRFVLRVISRDLQRNHPSVFELATLEGRALARFELPPAMFANSFTPRAELLATRLDVSAPLEVLPIDGGSPTRLNETGSNDQVLGWSADGQRVLFQTVLDGEDMLFFAPIDGGAMRQVPLPEKPLDGFRPVLSANGRHLFYAAAGADADAITLKVMDLEHGATREISADFFLPEWTSSQLSGRGGVLWRDGDDFLYVERHGDRFELRAAPADGPSRLLRTFDNELPYMVAVYDDRVAYGVSGPDGYKYLMLARAGDDEVREVLTVRGALESYTWSPDGRRLTVAAYRRLPPDVLELLSLEVTASGEVAGDPTVLDTPDAFWWSPRWLPNGQGLLVQDEVGEVWRISLQPGVRPVPITGDLPADHEVWDFRISPDGQYIAYARSIFRGSSIWRIDLGDALAAER
jgi:Tol biopolymer transport system component